VSSTTFPTQFDSTLDLARLLALDPAAA